MNCIAFANWSTDDVFARRIVPKMTIISLKESNIRFVSFRMVLEKIYLHQ